MNRLALALLFAFSACTDVPTPPAQTLSGRLVVDVAGTVTPVGGRVALEGGSLAWIAGADGRFTIDGLPAGSRDFLAFADSDLDGTIDHTARLDGLDTAAPKELGDVVLAAFGSVAGTVTVGGVAAADVDVVLSGQAQTRTDAAGHYAISGVWPGAATVGVLVHTAAGIVARSVTVEVASGGPTTADFALEAGAAATPAVHVRGAVALVLVPVDGVVVTLTPTEGAPANATVLPDGTFDFPAVPPGVYRLAARREGSTGPSLSPLLVAGADLQLAALVVSPATKDCGLAGSLDGDNDGIGDRCDNCPAAANADQADPDGDGLGVPCGPDRVAPRFVSSVPADGATGVDPGAPIRLAFDEPIDDATAPVVLAEAVAVEGAVTVEGSTIVFTPAAHLPRNSAVTVTLPRSLADVHGNPLASPVSFSFTTAGEPDVTAPRVGGREPAPFDARIPIDMILEFSFDEEVDRATVTASTVALRKGLAVVPTELVLEGRDVTLEPLAPMEELTVYTVFIAGVKDLAGNAMDELTWTFTTGDFTPPEVLSKAPIGAGFGADASITITFSEEISPSFASLELISSDNPIWTNIEYDAPTRTATFIPFDLLAWNTQYTVTLLDVLDLADNHLAAPVTWTFSTRAAPDLTPPVMLSSAPIDGAQNVAATSVITVTFDDLLDPTSLDGATFEVFGGSGQTITGAYAANGKVATFTPASALPFGELIAVSLNGGIRNADGVAIASSSGFSFRVDCAACTLPQSCGGGGTPGQCGCSETTAAMCTRLARVCGPFTGNDLCGQPRTIDCGSCAGTCDGAGQCVCSPETNTKFCQRLHKDCGNVVANDNCGVSRSAFCSSGSSMQTGCWLVELCGGGGVPNQCGRVSKGVYEFPDTVGEVVTSVHAYAHNDAWAATEGGWILHHDGTKWTATNPGGVADLRDIFMVSANDGWAVGIFGRIWHWNGTTWTRSMTGLNLNHFSAVWGAASDDVWAAGDAGILAHWDGVKWSKLTLAETADLKTMIGTSATDVVIGGAGGVLWTWNGTVWTKQTVGVGSVNHLVRAPDGELFFGAGSTLWHRNGSAFEMFPQFAPSGFSVNTLVAVGVKDVLAVGVNTSLGKTQAIHWTNGVWGTPVEVASTTRALNDLDAVSPTEIYLVGRGGLLPTSDGTTWTPVALFPPAITQLWADPVSGDAIAVGVKGAVIKRDGSTGKWTRLTSATIEDLQVIRQVAPASWIAAGSNGAVVRIDGATVTALPTAPLQRIRGLLADNTPDLWAFTDSGAGARYQGGTWTAVSGAANPTGSDGICEVWGTSPDSFWMATCGGRIRYWNGTTSVKQYENLSSPFQAVWGTSATDLWVTGYTTRRSSDGVTWTQILTPTTTATTSGLTQGFGITGTSPTDVTIMGGNTAFTLAAGNTWRESWVGEAGGSMRSVASIGNGEVLVGGSYDGEGKIIRVRVAP